MIADYECPIRPLKLTALPKYYINRYPKLAGPCHKCLNLDSTPIIDKI